MNLGREKLSYLLMVGLGLIGFSLVTLLMGYEQSFLWMNDFSTGWLDATMPHATHLGQGIILTGIVIWWTSRKDSAWALSCIAGMLILVPLAWALKTQFFDDWDRPLSIFQGREIHYVALKKLARNSFPSGHSAAAAASLFFATALFSKRVIFWSACLGATAVFAGYSRVYIGAHFPGDVAAGLLVGMLVAFFSFWVIYPFFQKIRLRPIHQIALSRLGLTVAIGGIILLASSFYLDSLQAWDRRWLLRINGAHSPMLDSVMVLLSAKLPWLWVPIALIGGAWWKGGWPLALKVAIGLVAAIVLADRVSAGFFKPWVARLRPCKPEAGLLEQLRLVGGCGGMYGFVSSHASNFFAIAMMASMSFSLRWVSIVSMLFASGVAYSRVYLGVHYPGDVLGGLALGLLLGYIAWWIGEMIVERMAVG
jgi:undecaprenyl-diphosphatase